MDNVITSISEVQQAIKDELVKNTFFAEKSIPILIENAKDIEYQIKSAMTKLGIAVTVATPSLNYGGDYADVGVKVPFWLINSGNVVVVENPALNRGRENYATALDTALQVALSLSIVPEICDTSVTQSVQGGLVVVTVSFKTNIGFSLRQVPYTSEVQYLQSDGNQYILLPAGDYKGIDIVCMPEVTTSILAGCVGRYYIRRGYNTINFWTTDNYGFMVASTNSTPAGDSRAISYNMNEGLTRIQLHGTDVVIGTDSFTVAQPWSSTMGTIDGAEVPFALFGCYQRTTEDVAASQCKIGRCRIWTGLGDNETLAYDFIPVRVGDVGCFYDRAHPTGGPNNNGLYFSEGPQGFLFGPDAN